MFTLCIWDDRTASWREKRCRSPCRGKNLTVLAVDVLEPDQRVKRYLQDHPRSVSIVLTKDTNLAAMYNAQSYPIYVLIDRDGTIAAEQRGAEGERGLRRMLRRVGLESD